MVATQSGTEGVRGVPDGATLTRGTLVAAAVAVCVAQVALAIPASLIGLFQQDLGTSSSQLTWIADGFFIPVTLLELTFGVLGDLFGRKRLLVIGGVVLAMGELITFLTPGADAGTGLRVVIVCGGQIIAGIGAAALFPTSLAVIAAGVRTGSERARSISVWAAALSAGGFISPVLGGLAAKVPFGSAPYASWRWAFAAVLILGLVTAVVSAVGARDSSAPEGRSLDWPGQITIAVALFALLFSVIQGPSSGWGSVEVVLGFCVAVVFFGLFIAAERRAASPLLRLSLFRNRAFSVVAVVTVFAMFSFLGTAYSTSIRLASIQGFSPLESSIALVLLGGMCLVQLPLTWWLLEKLDPRWPLGVGTALIGVGDLWLAAVPITVVSIPAIVVPLILVGMGFGFAVSSVTAVTVGTVPRHLTGMASGATSQLRDFGFTLGPAVVAAIALSRAAGSVSDQVAASPSLQAALQASDSAADHVPPADRAQVEGAIRAVHSGPLGANAVPSTVPGPGGQPIPFNPLQDVAFHALGGGYSIGYLLCGIVALAATALSVGLLGGRQPSDEDQHDSHHMEAS